MQYISCHNCGGILHPNQQHICGVNNTNNNTNNMFFYDQVGYVNTLDNLMYKQRAGLDPHYTEFYQGEEDQKLSKEYMDRVTRESLEAKNKLFQAHMQQMRATQFQMGPYPPGSYPNQPQGLQDIYSTQQQQGYQPSVQMTQSQTITISPQPGMVPQQQQLVPAGYTLPINPLTTTQHAQQIYQLQHQQIHLQQMQHQLHQRQRAESYIRNKEKLARAAEIPYGWQFDPNEKMVNLDGTATPQFKGIILSIFKRFDVDGDNELSLTEANQLNAAAQVQPITEDDFYKITKLYSGFMEDDGSSHGIHAEALISMFTTNMVESPDGTHLEVKNLGYEISKSVLPRGAERQQMKIALLNYLKTSAAAMHMQQMAQEIHSGPSSPVRNASANVVLSSPSQMSSPSANQNFTSVSIPQNNNNVNPHFISSSPPVTISSSSCAKCNSPYCVGVC